ncbi:MAG TPA: S9 family peptidase [Bacteroidetes bacterium]|nr:S9 family peptidase [Bacteroidota bacterium]
MKKYPIAKKIPVKLQKHGDIRIDNYYWMRLTDEQKKAEHPDEQTTDVLNYLNAENEYLGSVMKDNNELRDNLFEEMKSRIKKDDSTVPYFKNGYLYSVKYEKGKEYPIYTRKKGHLDAEEEILLDVNINAKSFSYYNIHSLSISPDNNLMIYGEDTLSRRIYTLRFKEINSCKMLSDSIEGTTGYAIWANDNQTVFYAKRDAALRSYKIFKHILGTNQSDDIEVFHEKDETFSTYVYKSKDNKYIIIGSRSTVSDEFRILDVNNPSGHFKLFQKRIRNLEYNIYHHHNHWYIRTNKDDALNFKIMKTEDDKTSLENWVDYISHKKNVFISDLDIFEEFMVVSERVNGNTTLRVIGQDADYTIQFPEDAYYVYTSDNFEFDTDKLRFKYTSLTTPFSTFDYDMKTGEKVLLKEMEVLGEFNKNNYKSERQFALARDGVKIPVSIVYKKDININEKTPLLLYGYGSYGHSTDPYFSSVRLSLLDRGFIFAIAHVRGGQEMGRQWYLDGKLLKKKNTFFDFIDVAKHLIQKKYTSPSHLYAMGGSAGGLLMGAVINFQPDLWNSVIAAVPFVDVLTTMLDDSIPLTTGEYDEWGNPNDEKYYFYMKSYSPYDNVEEKNYPNLLITTGYWDSQVQYWEPAKWTAKLREKKKGENIVLLHCNMETGHGGASGRFSRLKEVALEYTFLLMMEGIKK